MKERQVTSDKDGMVVACPECDKAPVYRRMGTGNATVDDPDAEYVCYDCGTSFDEPNERRQRDHGVSKLERILDWDL